jgi:hypothetical protein
MAPMALAIVVAAEPAAPDLPTALIQYGAIGILLGFFVWWSRSDKVASDRRWAEVNEKMFSMQERQIEALNYSADASKEQTRVMEELNAAMRDRPCMLPEKRR